MTFTSNPEATVSVAEKAAEDLNAIVTDKATDPSNLTRIAYLMREKGWESVTPHNLLTVARDLGFTVKGNHIYGEKQ